MRAKGVLMALDTDARGEIESLIKTIESEGWTISGFSAETTRERISPDGGREALGLEISLDAEKK